MGVSSFIGEQRSKQIEAHARPYLEDGETVVFWAHARDPESRKQGYAYVTDRRFIVHWSGGTDGHAPVEWDEISSWGIDRDPHAGPLLGVETSRASMCVQVPVGSPATASRCTSFLREFARRAPRGNGRFEYERHAGRFDPDVEADVVHKPRSITAFTRRLIVTILGVLLVACGIAIIPLPGPWSLPIVLGGLAILGSEYDIATDILNWSKEKYQVAARKLKSRRTE